MNAWLFDVDGVITDPTEKKITNPEILDEITNRLKKGDVIGLNTGRSIDFVVEKVLKPIEDKIENRKILDGIIAIGEKGGLWITYVNGERIEEIDSEIQVPEELEKRIQALIDSEYSETMFFDNTKKTMISTEMVKGMNLDAFHEEQKILVSKLQELLNEMKLTSLKIDPTTIATDIENVGVGKERGTNRFLQIMKEKGFTPLNITAFGDSKSDFEMIESLKATGKPYNFIFVGENLDYDSSVIISTKSKFTNGTLEYLKAH